jgi:hypothetical protein
MPSFSYQGTFREGQWRAFRAFILRERRDFGTRAQVITAEMNRIGKIELLYGRDSVTEKVTQERFGVVVDGSPTSSIGKLLTAYCTLGGNPLDISLFLYPNDDDLPGMGFAYPKGFTYSLQGQEKDEDSNIDKYKPSRIGGTRDTDTQVISVNMGMARQAFIKEMYQKRILLEERILKLADLWEQLRKERIIMVQAQGRGSVGDTPWSSTKYNKDHSVPCLVYLFDSTFRTAEEDGRVPADSDINLNNLGQFPMLLSNRPPGEDNNAL